MRNPKFHAFLQHAAELHEKKNHDYAADDNPYSNFEFAASFAGVTVDQVFDVMIGIKQSRLLELTQSGKKPNNESVWDTIRDLAVYAMLKASYWMEVPNPAVEMHFEASNKSNDLAEVQYICPTCQFEFFMPAMHTDFPRNCSNCAPRAWNIWRQDHGLEAIYDETPWFNSPTQGGTKVDPPKP